jgi:hypothetical protein
LTFRKQLINIGILSKDDVLYASDPYILPVLDLARFSISFGNNLLRDSQLVEISHEPIISPQQNSADDTQDNDSSQFIVREDILFNFLANQSGDTIAICTTYPSDEDLKARDIASLSIEQFLAQKKAFIQAIVKRFVEVVDIDALSKYTPDHHDARSISRFLLAQIMNDLQREILQASQVIFKDDHAIADHIAERRPKNCTFIYAAVMHDSIACASRFFKNLSGIFKLKISENTQYADTLVGNLITAQLSTIISSAISIAKTRIRQVDLQIIDSESEEFFHITFYPVKNKYILVIFAKGDPRALRFFTETTARNLAKMKALDEIFMGNIASFKTVEQFLDTLPTTFELIASDDECEEIDYLQHEVEALDIDLNEQLNAGDDTMEQQGLSQGKIESDAQLFAKFKSRLHDLQLQTNRANDQNQHELAARKAKLSCLLSLKIGNKILAYYFQNKFNALRNFVTNSVNVQLDLQKLLVTCQQGENNNGVLLK